MVLEIPKGTVEKMEINKKKEMNPVMQDIKNGELRVYKSPILVHYGAVPRTWENPDQYEITDIGKFKGDGDPLDIMDFSDMKHAIGDVYPVKVFGALALVDQGEMDWKLIALDMADPAAKDLRDYNDFFECYHESLNKVRQWLRTYKMIGNEGENLIAFDGYPLHAHEAYEMVVVPAMKEWEKLMKGEVTASKFSLVMGSKH